MNHFHITLPSDSSMKTYPDNTVAHFTTKLAETIRLDGDYEVGLAEIIYPHAWYNIDNSNGLYWFGARPEGREIVKCRVKTGYYTDPAVLAFDLTKQAAKTFTDMPDFVVKFNYSAPINKFSIDVQSKNSNTTLLVSAELQKFLGIIIGWSTSRNLVTHATHVFELNRGLNMMYVYCDIASYSAVGDTKAPLLRVCDVGGKHGEMVRTIYTHPHYVPVARREFDSIEININTEQGTPMPFTFGKAVVTLHFRRRHSLLAAS
jgi:hypothetical protein